MHLLRGAQCPSTAYETRISSLPAFRSGISIPESGGPDVHTRAKIPPLRRPRANRPTSKLLRRTLLGREPEASSDGSGAKAPVGRDELVLGGDQGELAAAAWRARGDNPEDRRNDARSTGSPPRRRRPGCGRGIAPPRGRRRRRIGRRAVACARRRPRRRKRREWRQYRQRPRARCRQQCEGRGRSPPSVRRRGHRRGYAPARRRWRRARTRSA